MFGKSKLRNFADKLGGFEAMVSELIVELKKNNFFIAESKSTKILLKQNAHSGFNVIVLTLKSETEIKSKALKKENSRVDENTFSLNNTSQKNIALTIINGM